MSAIWLRLSRLSSNILCPSVNVKPLSISSKLPATSSKFPASCPYTFQRQFQCTSAQPQPQLQISNSCVKRLAELGQKKEGSVYLRVMVDSGGCSGFQYTFSLEDTQGKEDRLFEKDGAKVVVDEVSWDFLKGATVDYEEEMIRRAFAVIDNPNVEAGCGCGVSFSPKA